VKLTKKILIIIIIGGFVLFFGYLRDFIFKKINALLQAWDHDLDYSLPDFLSFLNNYQYDTIVNIKWGLTCLFWVIYLVISLITIKWLFNKKRYIQITIAVYSGILILSALFICLGFIFPTASYKMYEFARYLMGMAQSPVILMILIPAFSIYEKENKGNKQQVDN
jgi:hypothetical protein